MLRKADQSLRQSRDEYLRGLSLDAIPKIMITGLYPNLTVMLIRLLPYVSRKFYA